MTTEDNITPEQPKEVVHGIIKGQTTSTGATMYDGLAHAHMSFTGIGCLEAVGGVIILRGRNGQRDVLFTLERAAKRYFEWMDLVAAYARNGIQGWQEAYDIAKDFKAKICEAVAQCKQLETPVPPIAQRIADGATTAS